MTVPSRLAVPCRGFFFLSRAPSPMLLHHMGRPAVQSGISRISSARRLLSHIPQRHSNSVIVSSDNAFFTANIIRLSISNVFTVPSCSNVSKAHSRPLTQTPPKSSPEPGATDFHVTVNSLEANLPPHRKRQLERRRAVEAANAAADSRKATFHMPPDASSVLTTAATQQSTSSAKRVFSLYMALAKPRLTVLVVLTAMVPYALYPVPAFLTPTMAEIPSLSTLTLLFLTTGTFLCSASANSLNMLYEPKTDALMTRTRNRPLVRGLLSKRAAVAFAVFSAVTGTGLLYYGVNPTVAFLGASNIFIYAGIYTPFKALTAANTWVGAVVGGIPPLMGWVAAAGENATGDGSWKELLFASDGSSTGGWLMASLLFAWQFPHFMALSWPIREEYKAAGLRMLSWTNPARNGRVALRYSFVFFPICFGLCAARVTDWGFAIASTPVNGWLAWQAMRFWREQGYKGTARDLFWASVWHLPGILVLSLVYKKGMWTRIWKSIVGEGDDDEWEDELIDFEELDPKKP